MLVKALVCCTSRKMQTCCKRQWFWACSRKGMNNCDSATRNSKHSAACSLACCKRLVTQRPVPAMQRSCGRLFKTLREAQVLQTMQTPVFWAWFTPRPTHPQKTQNTPKSFVRFPPACLNTMSLARFHLAIRRSSQHPL